MLKMLKNLPLPKNITWRSVWMRGTSVVIIFVLAFTLVFTPTFEAEARRSGGRIGGGSFRAPSAPSRSYSGPSGGSYRSGGTYGGGGFGFPFIIPFFGFGGGFGGIFGILVMIAIANVVINAIRNGGGSSGEGGGGLAASSDPQVGIAQIQVGLLASAKELKKELDELALSADTGTANGRSLVLQEATLALLRHPEYWVYGSSQSDKVRLSAAEAAFNQLALTERSKFTDETLSNFNNQLRQGGRATAIGGDSPDAVPDGAGEYILVTIIAAALGNLNLPAVNDSSQLKQSLQTLGGISSDRLLAIEVLWTPQEEGDTLTSNDIISEYPELRLV
ncbi:slr0404 [Synechocystis sp. PCC 6803]|uniref:Protein FLAP1 homolog A n=1 Tax=Synechocystis sp. (strain ATCC 27184 / PCC 6803 / Kazusa) TaxID=1111708 RepID=FLPA_SYNY3|nr:MULTISPECIES: DUF1517 domain-containing protein [unclassified Synechocystis]AGF52223.1 hypothetical protein MYO_119820 [Synechocystis sp. PCC 6803]ALJ68168.1 hypothetical protein AOY38_10195 [Synechocystis sp. PCC 6803]AVP90013.1 DUF1517 domain-containing protein [Synechocystis sp. IPPAS B-1465]MBD2617732.1 DUF1517 domain-containing protein [Synechocystis sp. FACHB-898]MBD2640555.1 DUF1517 domain-containing protein [Synechocystis sp. FACHB-908]